MALSYYYELKKENNTNITDYFKYLSFRVKKENKREKGH